MARLAKPSIVAMCLILAALAFVAVSRGMQQPTLTIENAPSSSRTLPAAPAVGRSVPRNTSPQTSPYPIPNTLPVFGVAIAQPDLLETDSHAMVTVSCQIADSRVLPGSVLLQQRLAPSGTLRTVATMQPTAIDPTFFVATIAVDSSAPATLTYVVSAAFQGMSTRLISRDASVTITSPATATWSSYRTSSGLLFQYPPNWRVVESNDGTVTISRPDTAHSGNVEGDADLTITAEINPGNLSIAQFFSGDPGVDLFTDTASIEDVTIGGIASMQFEGLSSLSNNDVVVVPLGQSFLVIYSNLDSQLFKLFLSTLRFS
jgi:hypothetical protein